MPAGIYIYTQNIYISQDIYIYTQETEKSRNNRESERERDSKTKTNKKKEWFHFYIKYSVKNIAKVLPPCIKK